MQSLGEFGKRLEKFADTIPEQMTDIKKKAAIEFVKTAAEGTPKDTGQAQGNYITSLGSPDGSTIRRGASSASASVGSARAAVQSVQPGQSIHVRNNLPYIGRLDDGYSAKAPAGFIRSAANRARDIIRRSRLKFKV